MVLRGVSRVLRAVSRVCRGISRLCKGRLGCYLCITLYTIEYIERCRLG